MKSSFVMYGSWGPMVEAMSDEQAGQLIKACYALDNGKDYEITDPTVKIVFETVKATMDADREKYAEVSKKRRDAALASKSQQMPANANKSIQEDANASKCSFCSDLLYESASVSDSDNDKDIKEKIQKEKSASRRRVFAKPSLEEVREYCRQRKNKVDPENFMDFYESKGWLVGDQPMRDWKACVRTWEKREVARSGTTKKVGFSDYSAQRQYTADEFKQLERVLLTR